MSLARRLKVLEAKAREAVPNELTLAVFRRMMNGGLTEGEWRHYGPILEALRDLDEAARNGPYEFDAGRGVVVCSRPREESPPRVSGWKSSSDVRNC
jgi:hypothetical protein